LLHKEHLPKALQLQLLRPNGIINTDNPHSQNIGYNKGSIIGGSGKKLARSKWGPHTWVGDAERAYPEVLPASRSKINIVCNKGIVGMFQTSVLYVRAKHWPKTASPSSEAKTGPEKNWYKLEG
jgi:hypothetical protein